jgi:hypothetical protein
MTWPGRELPDGTSHGRMRASHADRDGVINGLQAAYVLGFVTKDEFDARVSQALAARTYADLAVLTSDLPAWLAGVRPPERAPVRARAAVRPVDRAIPACALLAAVAFAAAMATNDGWLALAAVVSALATVIMVASQMRAARRSRPPGSHGPGRGRIDTGPTAAAVRSPADRRRAIQRGRADDVRPRNPRGPEPLLSC